MYCGCQRWQVGMRDVSDHSVAGLGQGVRAVRKAVGSFNE